MSFGENLKQARLKANLTQKQLAEKLGIIQSNIHRWEANKITPNVDTLKKLALILKVSTDSLIFTEKEKKKRAK